MKTALKTMGIIFVALVMGLGLRMGIKTIAPGLYASVWGVPVTQPFIPPPAQKETPVKTATVAQIIKTPENHEPPRPIGDAAVYATGRIWNKKHSWVIMSDGTNRSLDDNTEEGKPRLERIRRHFMDYEGKRYYYKPKTDPAPPVVGTPLANPVPSG